MDITLVLAILEDLKEATRLNERHRRRRLWRRRAGILAIGILGGRIVELVIVLLRRVL